MSSMAPDILSRSLSPRPLLSTEPDSRIFTDRDTELQLLSRTIAAAENALVIGERGSGKTSLMNLAAFKLTKQGSLVVILKVLELGEHFSQQALITRLADELTSQYQKLPQARAKRVARSLAAGLGTIGTISDRLIDVRSASSLELLRDLLNQLRTRFRTIAIFLDDCDKLDAEEIWASLRGLRDRLWELNVSLVLSLLPDQVGVVTKPPLDQFFPYHIMLRKFYRRDLQQLIEKRLGKGHLTLSDSALDELSLRSSGNPRVALTILRHALQSGTQGSAKLSLERRDVRSASVVFSNVRTELERSLLSYLAAHPETSASDPNLVKEMGVTRSRLVQILSQLKSQGLVEGKKIGRRVVYSLSGE